MGYAVWLSCLGSSALKIAIGGPTVAVGEKGHLGIRGPRVRASVGQPYLNWSTLLARSQRRIVGEKGSLSVVGPKPLDFNDGTVSRSVAKKQQRQTEHSQKAVRC